VPTRIALLAAAGSAVAALALPASPAAAHPCLEQTLRPCLDMLVNWDRVRSLCVPPNAAAPFSC
jgi:hypothetical protein